ncbi:hypothetical protein I503_05361 [Candida albicans SC5314]|nr:hypothetical protein I503_05361 [Candida albicans SC5314]
MATTINLMTSIANTDIDVFVGLGKLPSDVIRTIVDYLPKCMLPELLYFPPIREVVASAILSKMLISNVLQRNTDYSECNCDLLDITPKKLKRAIDQWNIFPKFVVIKDFNLFKAVLDLSPQVLHNAINLYGVFCVKSDADRQKSLEILVNSNVKFSHLALMNFGHVTTLPAVTTSLTLGDTTLASYMVDGLKRLHVSQGFIEERVTSYNFPSSLEDLEIEGPRSPKVILPPNLRKLNIGTISVSIESATGQAGKLEELSLALPHIESFDEIGFVSPNLKILNIEYCGKLTNYDGLKKFQNLKELSIKYCNYLIGVFAGNLFPELKKFEYMGTDYDFGIPDFIPTDLFGTTLEFPPNLKYLSIKFASFMRVDLSTLVLPSKLKHLELWGVKLGFGYLHLSENLEYVRIRSPELEFDDNFRIPQKMKYFQVTANYFYFETSDFMYHLPDGLEHLQLVSRKDGDMGQLYNKVQWPKSLKIFRLHYFSFNPRSLAFLKLSKSCLEEIDIRGGHYKRLNADSLPKSVRVLILKKMGIQELCGSFERLNNLNKLLVTHTNLRNQAPIKLPVSSLSLIDLRYCKLDTKSPFVVSIRQEKNKNTCLKVKESDFWGMSDMEM